MHQLIHILIILMIVRWVVYPIASSIFRCGPPDRVYRKMRGERKRFQEQVLAELRRNSDATERQNEILSRILERLGEPTPPEA
jgi:hypothetical protein